MYAMNVFVDSIVFYLQSIGGISTYWGELFSRFSSNRDVNLKVNYSLSKSMNRVVSHLDFGGSQVHFPQLLRYCNRFHSSDADIIHETYYRLPMKKGNALVVNTVHDFTYEYYAHGLRRVVHSWQKNRAIGKSDGLIAISENTKKDILKYNPKTDQDSIKVIYNGVSADYKVISYLPTGNEKYVLFVGGRGGYKNFSMLVLAMSSVFDLKLYIVGSPLLNDEILILDKYLPGRYRLFISVNNESLNLLYNQAFAFVYPSLYEGFGIPVIESMAAGCPVIASNLSSIPEISGNAAILLDDISPEKISNALLLLKDGAYRSILRKKGLEQAKKFSWDRCYEETFLFYRELLEKRG